MLHLLLLLLSEFINIGVPEINMYVFHVTSYISNFNGWNYNSWLHLVRGLSNGLCRSKLTTFIWEATALLIVKIFFVILCIVNYRVFVKFCSAACGMVCCQYVRCTVQDTHADTEWLLTSSSWHPSLAGACMQTAVDRTFTLSPALYIRSLHFPENKCIKVENSKTAKPAVIFGQIQKGWEVWQW